MMRVFLDTSTILTGGIYNDRNVPYHPNFAAQLHLLTPRNQYIISPYVLKECHETLRASSPSDMIYKWAIGRIDTYFEELQIEIVPDCPLSNDIPIPDPNDALILGSAIGAKADAICTYNHRDFPSHPIPIRSPLSLLRENPDTQDSRQYFNAINLSDSGTLLFFGTLTSLTEIIHSDNGTRVFCDSDGYIQLYGRSLKRYSAKKPIPIGKEIKLTLRYNKTDFRASVWEMSNGKWQEDILSTGSATFSSMTWPVLCFVPDHSFNGCVQCISGVPSYVDGPSLKAALENYSLDATWGSIDIRQYLHRVLLR